MFCASAPGPLGTTVRQFGPDGVGNPVGSGVEVIVGVGITSVTVGVRVIVGVAVLVNVGAGVAVSVNVGVGVGVAVGSGVDVGLLGVLVGVAVNTAHTPEPMHAAWNTGVQLSPQLPPTGAKHEVIGTVH